MGKLSKEEALKAIQTNEASEVYLFSPNEYQDLLDNYRKSSIDTFERNRIAEVYDSIDKDFFSVTGVNRPYDQRTYKFWPDYVKGMKSDIEAKQTEIDELKSKSNPDLSREIEALRKASLEKDKDWQQKFDKMQNELTMKDINTSLDMASKGFKMMNLPDPVLSTFVESAKGKLSKSAKMIDGQIVFVDDEGNPRINKETFKPYTAQELLAVELEPIIDKGKKAEGGGTVPPKVTKTKDGKADINMMVPANVKNKVELTRYLIENGMPQGTPEFDVAYQKFGENLPLA